ncbi:MAG TPA: hypothetical protein VD902_16735 [Symbiobacteriaceae bacterium]|nr:hypothetical protein [Symbiobacteriaceae bacterium]
METVVKLDLGIRWDVGAPLPILIANDYRTYLAFVLASVNPEWDGTTINVVTGHEAEEIGVVTFERCWAMQFGAPNDEAFRGHRLWHLGLRPHAPYVATALAITIPERV